ncbi:hypothetical protein D770_15105 [Flammeovirgaceae bacterium 311]|nr:hypothetical protein D770_15105 [Flammeovirgaceae bacterium 311]
MSVGVRGGYGLYRIQFNEILNLAVPAQEWTPGLGGGIVFRSLNSPHLGLQLELLMEQRGWHLFSGTSEAYHVQEQHLSLPIQSLVIVGSGRLQLLITGGAFASYIFSDEILENGVDVRYPINYRRQPMQDWQYGLLGGLGPAVRLGNNLLQLEGRFAYTLSNRLEPNLARNDAFNGSQQMAVTVSLVWTTQLKP